MSSADESFFQRELDAFVPDRVFDAHCHLWTAAYASWSSSRRSVPPELHGAVGWPEFQALVDQLHPGREVAGLFLPKPLRAEGAEAETAWVAANAKAGPNCRGAMLVKPGDDPALVCSEMRRLGLSGLKCYHVLSGVTPSWEADIPSYLPEPLVAAAHEEGWVITLHMVKSRAVADPSNQRWIRHYCERYPRMKLILAHCARCFQPAHAFEGLPALKGLGNLYCDSSANCEPMAHAAVIRILGPDRLLYGSDFCVSHYRGRSVAAGDSFLWLYEDTPVWGEKHLQIQPVLIGLESLRALKWACQSERLTDRQVEDIFWGNAARALGIGGA